MSNEDDRQRYIESVQTWRDRLDASLRAEEGWLSLVGLFWLQDGENRIGSAEASAIRLPAGPHQVGAIHARREGVEFRAAEGVEVLWEGEPVRAISMQPDTSEVPTKLEVGDLTMVVISRGDRFGLRIWDRNAPARSAFPGRQWFPIDASYRLMARFAPYNPPRPLAVADVTGGVQEALSPGEVVFTLQGVERRLVASSGDEDGLFLIFADATSGSSTYPAGRYLVTAAPKDGAVELDFNRAYNPPCAFTPFATCPLPPEANHLPLRIEAGERSPRPA
jgi:uncharacterized protein (DUF1684 family)